MKFLALSFLAAPAFACDTGDTLVRKETSQRSSSCVVYGYCYGWNGHGNEWGYGYKMCNGSRVDKVVTEICAKRAKTDKSGFPAGLKVAPRQKGPEIRPREPGVG